MREDVITAAIPGPIPFIIIGKNNKIKQIKVKTRAIADFIPFLPPIKQRRIKKSISYSKTKENKSNNIRIERY